MKILSMLALSLLVSVAQAADVRPWNGRIYKVGSSAGFQEEIGWLQLVDSIKLDRQIVLGEKHLTRTVQSAQAAVIDSVVRATGEENRFHVAWEFLDYSDRARVAGLYQKFASGETNAEGFLKGVFGNEAYATYAPIVNAVKSLGGDLIATNLSREEKAPVVKGGIAAADPKLVPAGFALGSDSYLERFKVAMDGHATPQQIANYFAAQCLTDDVMAVHFTQLPFGETRFLVTGSFHSEYREGAVARILKRDGSQGLANLRFIDASDYSREELEKGLDELLFDRAYGALADYVIFVGEPGAGSLEGFGRLGWSPVGLPDQAW